MTMTEELPVILLLTNTRISCSLSLFSSLLILVAIFRSQLKLTRIYNRIMLGVSAMDTITSLAVLFTTLPMPNMDDIPQQIPGASGTVTTCNIQGFASNFGYTGSFLYVAGLSLYYLCRIRLHMSDDSFQRKIEVKVHIICTLIPLTLCTAALCLDLYNPASYKVSCSIDVYPEECIWDDNIECIRGSKSAGQMFGIIVPTLSILVMLFVTSSFITIILGSCKSMRNFIYQQSIAAEQLHQARLRKELIQQSIMYQVGFLVVWINLPLRKFFVQNAIMNVITATMLPLQGFFNAIIFFYHKIHNIKASNTEEVSICDALRYIFCRSFHDNEIQFTGMSKLESRGNQRNEVNIDVSRDGKRTTHLHETDGLVPSSGNFIPALTTSQDLQEPKAKDTDNCDEWSGGQVAFLTNKTLKLSSSRGVLHDSNTENKSNPSNVNCYSSQSLCTDDFSALKTSAVFQD